MTTDTKTELKPTSAKIVDEIFADLRDRRNLKWFFSEYDGPSERIDTITQNEIHSTWVKIIERNLK